LLFKLDVLLNDIPNVKQLRRSQDWSNMIHHALMTYRRLVGNCSFFEHLEVSDMLAEIEKKVGCSPRIDCIDEKMYFEGADGATSLDQ